MKLRRVDIFSVSFSVLLSFGIYLYIEGRKEAEPASNWYVLRSINVPDFVEGDDPVVTFESEVRQPVMVEFNVQAHKINDGVGFPPVCPTEGRIYRTPDDNKGLTLVKWSEFMAMGAHPDCQLPAGEFILKARVGLKIAGYPDKELDRASAPFRVLPKGSLLYVEPQQAQELQKLELADPPQ